MAAGTTRYEPAVAGAAELLAFWPLWLVAVLIAGAFEAGPQHQPDPSLMVVVLIADAAGIGAWLRRRSPLRLRGRAAPELVGPWLGLGLGATALVVSATWAGSLSLTGARMATHLLLGLTVFVTGMMAVSLFRKARVLSALPWGRLVEDGEGGPALELAAGDRVEADGSPGTPRRVLLGAVPEGCAPGVELTLGELRSEGRTGSPYRGGITAVHAATAWHGNAPSLARGVYQRALSWMTCSMLALATWLLLV